MTFEESLVRGIGSFVGGGTVVALLLWLTRNAIATAVKHAAAKEIEAYRGEIQTKLEAIKDSYARDIERDRQAYARDLERDRQEAARALEEHKNVLANATEQQRHAAAQQLETFKSQLTLGAEVRRQVAAQKVKALLTIVELGEPLIREVGATGPDQEARRVEMRARFNAFFEAVRSSGHFFSADVAKKWHEYSVRLDGAHRDIQHRGDANAYQRASQEYDAFLALARAELGIEAKKQEATT